jgi:hypothetical protein
VIDTTTTGVGHDRQCAMVRKDATVDVVGAQVQHAITATTKAAMDTTTTITDTAATVVLDLEVAATVQSETDEGDGIVGTTLREIIVAVAMTGEIVAPHPRAQPVVANPHDVVAVDVHDRKTLDTMHTTDQITTYTIIMAPRSRAQPLSKNAIPKAQHLRMLL